MLNSSGQIHACHNAHFIGTNILAPKQSETVVEVWSYEEAPPALKLHTNSNADWVILIPSSLVWDELEALLLRLHSEQDSINRRELSDGSVMLTVSLGRNGSQSGDTPSSIS